MRFYVGGTFTRWPEVRDLVDRITGMGHQCVHDWTRGQWFETDTVAGDGYTVMEHWPEMAQAEVNAVQEVAEHRGFCLFLGQQASLGWPTEFGMAIAFGVPNIFLVDPFKTTVFVALPQVKVFDDIDAALREIESFNEMVPCYGDDDCAMRSCSCAKTKGKQLPKEAINHHPV